MISPPPHPQTEQLLELRLLFTEEIDRALREAIATDKWPAIVAIPEGCHRREVKGVVFNEYRGQGWRVVHGIGTDRVELYRPVRS